MIYGRFQQKIDTSENWAKAIKFKPLEGEIIVYSDLNKYKTGDGVTLVNDLPFSNITPKDWNENDEAAEGYIANRPFYEDNNGIKKLDAKYLPAEFITIEDVENKGYLTSINNGYTTIWCGTKEEYDEDENAGLIPINCIVIITDDEDYYPPGNISYVQTYPYVDDNDILHIRYQDTYSFKNNIIEVKDTMVTSTVCGTFEPDEAAIVAMGDNTIDAVGCGSATVVFQQGEQKVIVDPSPINLLFVTGQSNASGELAFGGNTENGQLYNPTYAQYYMRTAPTMAYFTFTGQKLSIEKKTGTFVASEYVPTSLDWDVIKGQSFVGCNPTVFADENSDFRSAGWSAAMAHEWVEQTGERVWIVNAAHGGMPISTFLPSEDGTPVDNNYYQAISVFNLALETIYNEEEAGHFTLNHMAYYWFHGGADSTRDDAYYIEQFAKLHTAIQQDVVYQHNGVEKKLEYCGILSVRSNKDSSGNSNVELEMTGPRLAQYYAGGSSEDVFSNVYMVSNVHEKWTGSDENVENYFLEKYGSPEAFEEIFGYAMPVTRYELHPAAHFLMKGYNEIGMDAARNSLRMINATQPERNYHLSYGEDEPVSVKLLMRDGVTEWGNSLPLDVENGICMIPMVSPTYAFCRGIELRSETEGFTFDRYMLKATEEKIPSSITFSVYLDKKKYKTYTMQVSPASSFAQNFPQYSINDEDDSYTFLGYSEPWSTGYLTYDTGTFIPFNLINSNGWLYNGIATWGEGGQGAFQLTKDTKVGLANNDSCCSAIEYLISDSGTVGTSVDMFSPTQSNVYLAIAVNGEMVWPAKGGSLTNNDQWYLAQKDVDDTATLNEQWKDLRFEVEAGDNVTFLLKYANGTGHIILYPIIYYPAE